MFSLSSPQEEFLSKLFVLCSEYQRTANTECVSEGVLGAAFEVTIRLHSGSVMVHPCCCIKPTAIAPLLENCEAVERTETVAAG